MRIPAWYTRMNEAMGFYRDEHVDQVQSIAVRRSYLLLSAATVPLGAYLEYGLQQGGALWAALGVLGASLLVLGARRVQLGGLAPADERVIRSKPSLFLWPVLTLGVGMFAYVMYRGDTRGMMALTLYNMSVPFVVLLTHIAKRTSQGHVWYWVLMALFTLGQIVSVVPLFVTYIFSNERSSRPLPSISAILPLAFGIVIMVAFGIICVLGAWRSWQDRRGA